MKLGAADSGRMPHAERWIPGAMRDENKYIGPTITWSDVFMRPSVHRVVSYGEKRTN